MQIAPERGGISLGWKGRKSFSALQSAMSATPG